MQTPAQDRTHVKLDPAKPCDISLSRAGLPVRKTRRGHTSGTTTMQSTREQKLSTLEWPPFVAPCSPERRTDDDEYEVCLSLTSLVSPSSPVRGQHRNSNIRNSMAKSAFQLATHPRGRINTVSVLCCPQVYVDAASICLVGKSTGADFNKVAHQRPWKHYMAPS